MDIKCDGIIIPPAGYELIKQIKATEGRIDYLETWVEEITNYMKQDPRTIAKFDGIEVDGPEGKRRLRIVTKPAYRQPRFQYAAFQRSVAPEKFRAVVRSTPPKYPWQATLGAAHRGAATEWADMAAIGRSAEAEQYSNRQGWRGKPEAQIAFGAHTLKARIKDHKITRDAQRDELRAMIADGGWARSTSTLLGRSDGRLRMREAAAHHELIDREAAFRQHPVFVKYIDYPRTTSVGFYGLGEEDSE